MPDVLDGASVATWEVYDVLTCLRTYHGNGLVQELPRDEEG